MKLNIKNLEGIALKNVLPAQEEFYNLFTTTGWNKDYNLTPEELHNSIQSSWKHFSLYSKSKLIGFGRIISDGILHALIADVIIHPDFQNKGMGSMVIKELIKVCKDNNIKDIQLFAAKGKYAFYEKSGFTKRPIDAPGMEYIYNR
jgi:ribosomal protein S18 acetylase RimI-like enzyme